MEKTVPNVQSTEPLQQQKTPEFQKPRSSKLIFIFTLFVILLVGGIFAKIMIKPSQRVSPEPTAEPTPTPGLSNCSVSWQDYPKEKYGYKMKIPPNWTAEAAVKPEENDSLSEIDIVSTLRPAEQMDPSYKISRFMIVASKNNIKTDENYQGMFENSTGNQIKSQVDFKGISAEKYVDETEMVCSGPVQAGSACAHRFENYYFQKGDFYYLLSLGIYLTPDLKAQNESILNCFLDSFELTQP